MCAPNFMNTQDPYLPWNVSHKSGLYDATKGGAYWRFLCTLLCARQISNGFHCEEDAKGIEVKWQKMDET